MATKNISAISCTGERIQSVATAAMCTTPWRPSRLCRIEFLNLGAPAAANPFQLFQAARVVGFVMGGSMCAKCGMTSLAIKSKV